MAYPTWQRAPGEGNGIPLHYSCWENPVDGRTSGLRQELDTTEGLSTHNLAEISLHTHPSCPLSLPARPRRLGNVLQTYPATLRLSIRSLPNTVLCSAIANQSCRCFYLKCILGLASINIRQTQRGQRKWKPLLLLLTNDSEGAKEVEYIPFSKNAGIGGGRIGWHFQLWCLDLSLISDKPLDLLECQFLLLKRIKSCLLGAVFMSCTVFMLRWIWFLFLVPCYCFLSRKGLIRLGRHWLAGVLAWMWQWNSSFCN